MSICMLKIMCMLLVICLLVVLVVFGMVFVEIVKEKQLEVCVVEFECQVQLLLFILQQQQIQISQVQIDVIVVCIFQVQQLVMVIVLVGKQLIQVIIIILGVVLGIIVKIGGFIKVDFLVIQIGDGQFVDDVMGCVLYLLGQILVVGVGGSGQWFDVDFNVYVKFLCFNLGIDNVLDKGNKFGVFFEMDFFGNLLGNQIVINIYGVILCYVYMYWNNWMVGQIWFNFMDVVLLLEVVDFVGLIDGVLFVCQVQICYICGGFSVVLENFEIIVLIGICNLVIGVWINVVSNVDCGVLLDLILCYGWKGDWGIFGVGGIVCQFKVDNQVICVDVDKIGGGLILGGKWVMGDSDILYYQFSGGEGIVCYVGLGVMVDIVYDIVCDEFDLIGVLVGYVGWCYVFSFKLCINLIYVCSDYDNSGLFGFLVIKSVQSICGNVFYMLMLKVDIGVEYMYGVCEIEDGCKGDINCLQFIMKYSF